MKFTYIVYFLFLCVITQAQNADFSIQKGGYLTEELGGYGLPSLLTIGYEYVKPLNKQLFLSTRVGINGMAWLDASSIGIPHGVSLNFGKKHFFLETGLNGWAGFYQDDEAKWDNKTHYKDYFYLIGANIGLNTAFRWKNTAYMYRLYINPSYNTSNNDLLRKTFVWGGTGISIGI